MPTPADEESSSSAEEDIELPGLKKPIPPSSHEKIMLQPAKTDFLPDEVKQEANSSEVEEFLRQADRKLFISGLSKY